MLDKYILINPAFSNITPFTDGVSHTQIYVYNGLLPLYSHISKNPTTNKRNTPLN